MRWRQPCADGSGDRDRSCPQGNTTAARAVKEGRTVFLYRFNVPAMNSGYSEPISGAAEVIEGVEKQGWRFGDFAYDAKQSSHGAVLLLFRRSA